MSVCDNMFCLLSALSELQLHTWDLHNGSRGLRDGSPQWGPGAEVCINLDVIERKMYLDAVGYALPIVLR